MGGARARERSDAELHRIAQSSGTNTAAPVITGPSTINGQVGTPFDIPVAATNGPREFAVRGGTRPPGINFDMMAGRFVGSPTTAGTYRLDIAAANYSPTGPQWSAVYTVTFNIANGTPTPTTPAEVTGPRNVSGVVGQNLSATLTASRPVLHYRIDSGTIPPGLGFEMNGAIRGTPTQAGTFTLSVVAVSQGSTGQQESAPYPITIGISANNTSTPPPAERAAPVITGPSSGSGQVGQPFSLAFTATNNPTSYHIEFGAVPPGTQFDTTAGVIRGTPTQAGTYRLDVMAHNISNGAPQSSPRYSTTITISPASNPTPPPTTPPPTTTPTSTPPPQVTGPFTGSGRRGEPFSLIISASNNPNQFTLRGGTLPQGLIMDTGSTLTLRGTPTQVGTFTVSVAAANTGLNGAQWGDPATVTITIAEGEGPPVPVITGPFSASGQTGHPFSLKFTATNNPRAYAISEGSLPPGIRADLFGGELSGTPTEAGTFAFSVMAENAGANNTRQWSAPVRVTITIATATSPPPLPPPSPGPNPSAPVISGPAEASGQTGQPFTLALNASNNPTQFAVRSGTLPPGLTLDAATGRITGTPQLTGSATVTIAAANGTAQSPVWGEPATVRFTITAGPAAAAPVINGPATASGTVGQPFSVTFNTANQPREYAIRGGSLPSGLRADLMAGAIVGTPTEPGTFRIDFAAANSGATGPQWSQPFTITLTIAPAAPSSTVVTTPPTSTTPPPPSNSTPPPPPSTPTPPPTATVTPPAPSTSTSSAPTTIATTTPSTPTAPANTPTAPATASTRAPQTITVSAPLVTQPSAAPFPVTASSSADLPVTVEVVSGPAVVQNNIVTLTGETGVVALRATQPGTTDIEPVEVIRTFMVAPDSSQLANVSARMAVNASDPNRAFLTGFVVGGNTPRRVLLRALGPALASFGVDGALADPSLKVLDATGRVVAENDNWQGADTATVAQNVGAFPLAPATADAALVVELAPGAYSMQVTPKSGQGIALAEVFYASEPATHAGPAVINVSTRGFVGGGAANLTTGFVISGDAPKRVLIRGAGPALAAFGVTDALADPILTLHRGATVLAENDNWNAPTPTTTTSAEDITAATRTVGAFALPAASKDAAILLDLPPGAYTATISSAANTTGTALIEVYEVSSK